MCPARENYFVSGGCEADRIGEGGVGALDIAQGLADDLLGDAGAFPALSRYARSFTHFTIAAATFIDSVTDLTVGYTLAKTDVHKNTR